MRLLPLLLLLPAVAFAQQPDPKRIFAPFAMPQPEGLLRSGSGVPGPAYWQNRADYDIQARIEPSSKTLSATETITYTNNSPDALGELWVMLEQNIYRRDARAAFMPQYRPRQPDEYTDGDKIDDLSVEQDGKTMRPFHLITDTRMQVRLPRPLPHGATIKLHVSYHYSIPGDWGGRTAVTSTKDGDIYEIAQWYPRMAVYDDLRGWDTAPYLGSEFYLEYGDFTYAVTVPWNFIVAGSGALQNPDQVLTKTEITRLAQAQASDRTVMILAPDEIGKPDSRPVQSGELTWKFRMENTRDAVFTASPAYAWDAARINLPDGKHALAMSVYPAESAGNKAWGRSTEYVKSAIEDFSKRWFPYPWPVMVNVGGHGAGMEYPGIVFDDRKDSGKDLFWITTHEVGHSWFPMIVGSNERRNAWMDEGFNTFIDVYQSDDFNHGEYGPKRDAEYAPGPGAPADQIVPWLTDPSAPVILTAPDLVTEKYRHPFHYFKPALGLVLLREQILGPARFDAAFRDYIAAWAFRHPSPSDFFRLMDSRAGEDLSWFWRGWFAENHAMWVTIPKAAYVDNDYRKGVRVTLSNHGDLVMPARLEINFADGSHQVMTIPVEAWMKSDDASFDLPTVRKVASLTLDPKHKLPIADRADTQANVKNAPGQ